MFSPTFTGMFDPKDVLVGGSTVFWGDGDSSILSA